jgi:hypothetical protein
MSDTIIEPDPGEVELLADKNWEITRHHAPTAEGLKHISNIRAAAKQFLDAIDQNCPPCADSTFAKRMVRIAMMVANASIVLDGMV